MMIEVQKISQQNQPVLKTVFEIRFKVFVDEQHVPASEEFDEFESLSTHFIATFNRTPCGAARWRRTDKGVKLERFAVLMEYRSKGIGGALLSNVLKDVMPLKLKIYLHAQVSAEGFYLKNNFISVGEHFMEAGIEHVLMVWKGGVVT